MAATIEFWFEFASTYSYLASEEIEEKSRVAGVAVVWRPFLLGPIFARQGWRDSPFNLYPAKGAYMWRDLDRLCREKRLPWRRPSQFPRNGLLAARVATALEGSAQMGRFVKAIYRANLVHDLDISDSDVIATQIATLGLNPEELLRRAAGDDNKALLRARTEEAERRGVFGAPSFFVGAELFWGADRLDQALVLARAIG
jgi:2-hydroxychromene-2-carboxylate isomerase